MTHPRPPKFGEMSTNPKSVQNRVRNLHSDVSEKDHARHQRTKGKRLLHEKMHPFTVCNKNPYWASRVRHHLRKGRDAADIVVRENIPASIVTKLIEEIHETE